MATGAVAAPDPGGAGRGRSFRSRTSLRRLRHAAAAMTPSDHHRTGAAMRWRAMQLAGVQGVYFLRLLLLAQLLAPDAFGMVAVAMVAIGVIARITDLGMVPALVQCESAVDEEYDAAWTVGLMRALMIALILSAFALPVATVFGEPSAAPVIQALAWRPVIEAAASIGIVRLTRQMEFRRLAMIAVPAAVVDLAVAVLTAGQIGVWALVAGALAGSGTTLLLSYLLAPHRPRFRFRFETIRPLIRYGRWVMATGIIALVGSSLSQIAISRIEGVAALGLYFLAWRVAFLPIDAMSAVVSSVAFPMFARIRDDTRKTASTFRTLLTGECAILLPGYALVFVLAPALEAVLGERWAGTTPIIRILSVAAVTGTLGELVTPLLMGRGQCCRAAADYRVAEVPGARGTGPGAETLSRHPGRSGDRGRHGHCVRVRDAADRGPRGGRPGGRRLCGGRAVCPRPFDAAGPLGACELGPRHGCGRSGTIGGIFPGEFRGTREAHAFELTQRKCSQRRDPLAARADAPAARGQGRFRRPAPAGAHQRDLGI